MKDKKPVDKKPVEKKKEVVAKKPEDKKPETKPEIKSSTSKKTLPVEEIPEKVVEKVEDKKHEPVDLNENLNNKLDEVSKLKHSLEEKKQFQNEIKRLTLLSPSNFNEFKIFVTSLLFFANSRFSSVNRFISF